MSSWDFLRQAWHYAGEAAVQASGAWATVNGPCRGAVVFSTYQVLSSCMGYEPPVQYTRGFGPFALAWGWCLVGLTIGFLIGLNFWDLLGRLEQVPQRLDRVRRRFIAPPPGLQVGPPWQHAIRDALAVAIDVNHRIVLQRLLDDGDAALQLLAASTGVSKRAALVRVLGEHVVQANALAWGL